MSAPSAAWLAAAAKYGATPVFVYRLPDHGGYFASQKGHYPDGASEPYHAGIIVKGRLPVVTREIRDTLSGRIIVSIAEGTLVDAGEWDSGWGDYQTTLRGARLHGYVTFPGLAWADAVFYLNARITELESTDRSRLRLTLQDATREATAAAWLPEGSATSATLGSVVLARLQAAGLVYPTDFDTAAWTAWTASGKPGAFVVTTTWTEGELFDVLDGLLAGTLSIYGFTREGKFTIRQFADLAGSPTPDIDLTTSGTLRQGGSMKTWQPVIRKETVKYNAGAASVSRTVNLSTGHAWWPTAREAEPVDIGLTGSGDAGTLASQRLLVSSAERALCRVHTDARPLGYDVGAIVKLAYGDHLLPDIAQQYHQVWRIVEDPNAGGVELGLITALGAPPQP